MIIFRRKSKNGFEKTIPQIEKPDEILAESAEHRHFKKTESQNKKVFGKIPKTINYLSSIITNLQQHQLPLK